MTKFNEIQNPYDKKSRLYSQLKFFGAKKQKFISVYAKKPRIRVEVKNRESKDDCLTRRNNANLSSMMAEYAQLEAYNNFLRNQSSAAMQRNNLYHSPLFVSAQSSGYYGIKAARAQIEAQERAMDLQRVCAAFGAATSLGLLDI